jgi:mono/diheme cytochrome c family protein
MGSDATTIGRVRIRDHASDALRSKVLGLAGLLLAFALGATAPARAADLARGAQIYAANCAACHGPQGRPDAESPLVKGLGVMPANFADPLFNSREPLSDWKLVVGHGGPVLGFSEMMPAFASTLTEEEIDAVLAYVKTLGGKHDYPDGALNLFLPLRTRKAFPEDEWVWKQRYTDQDGADQWRNTLEYEWRIGQRWQGVLEISHQFEGGDERWDVFEPGFKYVFRHDTAAGFIATVGANLGVPLRTDRDWELLPYVAVGKILSDDWTFQGSARLKLSLEHADNGSAEFAGVVHWIGPDRPRSVFPALEVVAEMPFDPDKGDPRTDAVQVSLLPQARIGLNKRGNIALNVGVEVPVNDTWRYHWRGYVYFIWDFADGGLFEGW